MNFMLKISKSTQNGLVVKRNKLQFICHHVSLDFFHLSTSRLFTFIISNKLTE